MSDDFKQKKLRGLVESFNFSPGGAYDAVLIRDGERLLQLNFSHSQAEQIALEVKVGAELTATVEVEHDKQDTDHPVFRLLYLGEDVPERRHFEGAVARINYTRRGEPNGAVLEGGEFIHLRPEGARAVQLKVGQKLVVDGESRESPSGNLIVEAASVNDIPLRSRDHKHDKKHDKDKKSDGAGSMEAV